MQHSDTTTSPDLAPALGADLHRLGLTGHGVGIAVIDSGVDGADLAGRLAPGLDLTADAGTAAEGLDRTGHGTHLATLAAGTTVGSAPGAHVVPVKVASERGVTRPEAVVAALDACVAAKDRLGIRVVLLAFGADQLDGTDPLAAAVARAWDAGLVVVTSAGNEGHGPLPTPAHIDRVLTVGAGELVEGTWARCEFSTPGQDDVRPDVLAPGRSLVSALAQGSEAEAAPAESHVALGWVKGSGSSQAAGVAAGVVALLLEADPTLGPDEVKAILRASAARVADPGAGAGAIDPAVALACLASGLFRPSATSELAPAVDGPLAGAYAGLEWSGLEWSGFRWSGFRWSGLEWSGFRWSGLEWSGLEWSGFRWSGLEWSGFRWSGFRWSGLEWSGFRWSGLEWSGLEWSGLEWSGFRWSGFRWSGLEWS